MARSLCQYVFIFAWSSIHPFINLLFCSLQVHDDIDGSSSHQKQLVDDTVDQLRKQGLLSGETLGQMFRSVSDILNSQSSDADKDARQEVHYKHERSVSLKYNFWSRPFRSFQPVV